MYGAGDGGFFVCQKVTLISLDIQHQIQTSAIFVCKYNISKKSMFFRSWILRRIDWQGNM